MISEYSKYLSKVIGTLEDKVLPPLFPVDSGLKRVGVGCFCLFEKFSTELGESSTLAPQLIIALSSVQ